MKTTKSMGLLALFFSILMLGSMTSKAQCGGAFFIQNTLGCNAVVHIDIWDACYTHKCNSQNVNVPAGQTVSVPCGLCANNCDIEAQVVDIGGTAVTGSTSKTTAGCNPISPTTCSSVKFCYNSATHTFIVQ